jgi:hypothetical protein
MTTELIEPTTEQTNTLPAAPEERAALALNSTKTAADLRALVEKHQPLKGIEVKDKATRDQLHGAGMELRTARTTVARIAKDARDDATKFSKAVIAAEKELIAITEPLEEALLAQRDAWDEAERARKEAEAAAERARLLAISEKIAGLRNYLTLASQCRSSERIQSLFDKLAVEEITEAIYAEFEAEAAQAKAETLARIKPVLEAKLAEEAEREAEQRRIEAERLAAAEAQRAAAEAQRIADEAAAKVAAERAELERQQREFAEQQAELQRQQIAVAAAAQEKAVVAEDPPAVQAQWPDADGVIESPVDMAMEIVGIKPEPIPGIDDVADVTSEASLTAATTPTSMDRPTDDQLIEVLAQHYRVHESKVIAWLLDMDMDAAAERMAQEFA